ncbi:secreted RxLR effector protein 161-like protein [Tanacetum coccineum]
MSTDEGTRPTINHETQLKPIMFRTKSRRRKQCTFCVSRCHTKNGCFKVIGYPDWWPGKDRQGKQRPRTVRVEGELWPTLGITEALLSTCFITSARGQNVGREAMKLPPIVRRRRNLFTLQSIWDDEVIKEKSKDLIGEPNETEIGHSEPIEEFEDDFEHHTQTDIGNLVDDQTEGPKVDRSNEKGGSNLLTLLDLGLLEELPYIGGFEGLVFVCVGGDGVWGVFVGYVWAWVVVWGGVGGLLFRNGWELVLCGCVCGVGVWECGMGGGLRWVLCGLVGGVFGGGGWSVFRSWGEGVGGDEFAVGSVFGWRGFEGLALAGLGVLWGEVGVVAGEGGGVWMGGVDVGDPRQSHMDVADRLLRYLKATLRQGILIPKGGGINLTTYSDSDWALGSIGRVPILREAEYRAMANAVSEVLWMRWLLSFLETAPRDDLQAVNASRIEYVHIPINASSFFYVVVQSDINHSDPLAV